MSVGEHDDCSEEGGVDESQKRKGIENETEEKGVISQDFICSVGLVSPYLSCI
jgi:hypothetical protein